MKVRNLKISIEEALDLFDRIKWKFFTTEGDNLIIEVPRSDSETWKVIKEINNPDEYSKIVKKLTGAGFIEQELEMELEY